VPMGVGRERAVAVRVLWIFLVSPLVCAAVGVIGGAITLAAQIAVAHPEAKRGVLSEMLLYGGVAGLLFGLVGGLVGALVVSLLGVARLSGASRRRWVKAGFTVGGGVGLGGAILAVSGAGVRDAGNVVFAIGCTLACAVAGLAVGFLGWREFGSSDAPGTR
jgi:hypothetical protein